MNLLLLLCIALCSTSGFPQPYVFTNQHGDLHVDLKVAPVDIVIGPCSLRVRGYHYLDHGNWYPSVPGPTLQVYPGQNVTLTIQNHLEEEDEPSDLNILSHPNITNVHVHGAHMWPKEDYITNEIQPLHNFTYKYHFVPNHYPGTHWYHAHVHGSVSLQVMSGMAGALIMRPPKPTWHPSFLRIPRYVVMLQSWNFDGSAQVGGFGEATFNVYQKEMNDTMPDNFHCTGDKNDFFTVNGELTPSISILRNQQVIFEMVNTAGEYVLELELEGCEMWILGRDGIYVDNPYISSSIVLLQGSRGDVGIQCADPGHFSLKTTPSSARDSFLGTSNRHTEQDLITIMVSPISQRSPGSFENMSFPPRPYYLADTFNANIAGKLSIQFDFIFINEQIWDGNVTHTMKEGEVYEFHLSSAGDFSHPYHQHINHFQVIDSPLLDLDTEGALVKKGMWLDVLLTASTLSKDTEVRFLADKFTGEILIHCHYLVHSDLGMMQFLAIEP